MARRSALGKGLKALIPEIPAEQAEQASSVQSIEVSRISANPFQPREHFDDSLLEELKQSIAEKGLVQPVTVRVFDNAYQLIAGERRLRAVRDLGLEYIPAFVLQVEEDEDMLELSIIENIHRENLNPVEIAKGFQRLIEEIHLTQEQVAKKVGKDRSTVTNFLRLLKLPRRIQESIVENELSMGHARTLITLKNTEDQIRIWHQIVKNSLSVRKTEKLVREFSEGKKTAKTKPKSANLPPSIREAEDKLRQSLATQVHIKLSREGGIIDIEFYTDEDLDRIIDAICD